MKDEDPEVAFKRLNWKQKIAMTPIALLLMFAFFILSHLFGLLVDHLLHFIWELIVKA